MIKLVNSNEALLHSVCSNDVFGTRISAYFMTYGNEFDFFNSWIQINDNNQPCAAICLINGHMTLTCTKGADFEELAAFVEMTNFTSLQCERSVAKKLSLTQNLWGYVVRFDKKSDFSLKLEEPLVIDYKEIYSLIKNAGLIGVFEYLPWLSDIKYKEKKGTAKIAAASVNGKIASSAMALFITKNAALLGAVATDPAQRGKGLAGALVTKLGNEMLEQKKRVELLCANDSIVNFYKSLGFKIVGEWSMIERKE